MCLATKAYVMQHIIIFSNGSKFRLVSNFTVTLKFPILVCS